MASQPSRRVNRKARPEQPDEPIPLDSFMPYLMNRLMARLNQNLTDRLRHVGLSFQHWRIVLVLAMRGPRTMSQLIEETVIPQSTLSRMLMRMERDGLITRRTDARDTRVLWVDLTARGREMFARIYPLGYAEYHRAARHLTEEEEEIFLTLLRRMMERVCLT